MIGQVAAGVVLLAIGCNVITGVGDLKVSEPCALDAGSTCDPDPGSTTDVTPLEPSPDDGTGGTGSGVRDGGTSSGRKDECSSSRDIPPVFSPMDVIGIAPDGCGPSGIPLGGGNGGGTSTEQDAGASPDDGRVIPMLCTTGEVQACSGAGNCPGLQICLADGTGFSSCQCAPTPPLGGGSVAAACATDADCKAGLTCTTSADSGGPFSNGAQPGGPQGGYCSRSCNTDAECQAAEPGAICLGPGNGQNHCFASCDLSTPSFPLQCNGRDDLTCVPLAADGLRAYCAPACHEDAACAPRFCNLSTGLCQDEQATGKPLGAGCTSGDECAAGVCFALRGQPSVCTGLCTFGSPAGCGFGADASERDAACLDTALGNGAGPGLCTELCEADSDCEQQADGWTCTPWPVELILALPQAFASAGFCELLPGGGDEDGAEGALCSEGCIFTGDGDCDDGGPGSDTKICPLGTDCLDCGAR